MKYPDIPGCVSDGETIQAAIANGREALRDCLEVFRESGRKPVKPSIESAQVRLGLQLVFGSPRATLQEIEIDDADKEPVSS